MEQKFNRRTILALSGVFILIFAAVGIYLYNTGALAGDPEISEEEAIAIAEEYTNGKATSVELEKEGISMVYEVVCENDTGVWEVEVDADNGDILEIEEDDDDEEDDDNDDDNDDDEHDDDMDPEEDDDADENEHEFGGEEEGDN